MKVLMMAFVIKLTLLTPLHLVSQTRYDFKYRNQTVDSIFDDLTKRFKATKFLVFPRDFEGMPKTTIVMEQATIREFLDSLCQKRLLRCEEVDGCFIISKSKRIAEYVKSRAREITIIVADIRSKPILGATVYIPEYNIQGATNDKGEFKFSVDGAITTAIISHIGYKPEKISTDSNPVLAIMKASQPVHEQEQVVNYTRNYTSTSTGPIVHIDNQQLGQRPGKSIYTSLTGVAPGVTSSPSNGSYGVMGKIQIRNNSWLNLVNGASAITQNAPLVIIDKVPFPTVIVSQLDYLGAKPNSGESNATGASMMRYVNIDDIESIEILKDAEATALYGTKGANGVIIINTKKAKKSQAFLTVNLDAGIARARLNVDYLNTSQYIDARKEAFANDKEPITRENAPDLVVFDSTRYINYDRYFLGGTASTLRTSVTHGQANDLFGYRVRLGLYREGTILPDHLVGEEYYDQDIDIHGDLYLKSKDGKYCLNISGNISDGKTLSIAPDITSAVRLAPNTPPLIDSMGEFIWYNDFINPLPYLRYQYKADVIHMNGRAGMRYTITPKFAINANVALLIHKTDEKSFTPIKAQDPRLTPKGEATFASLFLKNMFAELTGEYKNNGADWQTSAIVGTSGMRQTISKDRIDGLEYNSDILLPYLGAAGDISAVNNITKYGYVSFFGNGKMLFKEKYAVSMSGRLDGSSRFGANSKYGFFGGIGLGWTISREKFFQDSGLISYLKAKMNYGTSGNDEIGDFVYRGLWASSTAQRPYAGITTFYPTTHRNNEYGWGLCRKFEASVDVTFREKVQLTASFYHNSYTKQIVLESLPNFTGFGSIVKNNNSIAVSKGVELSIKTKIQEKKNSTWTVSANLTFPRTKLKRFPGLKRSNYANSLTLGVPVGSQKGLMLLEVNRQTGVYEFLDRDQNGQFTPADYIVTGSLDPFMYGGLQNVLQIKRFTLDFALEYASQKGINYLLNANPMVFNANAYSNVPEQFLDRWRQAGDKAAWQQFSATTGSETLSKLDYLRSSNLQLTNANYLRLKMVSLSYQLKPYTFPKKWENAITIYAVAENALLITKYRGADPLSQNGSGIPVLKRYSLGVKLNIN